MSRQGLLALLLCASILFESVLAKAASLRMLSSSGRGFGRNLVSNANGPLTWHTLKPSRTTEFKSVIGKYAKLLGEQSRVFDDIIRSADHTVCDVYANLSECETYWFIGKVAHANSLSSKKAFSVLELLLKEYSKSLRPRDLAGPAAGSRVLQLWYAPGNSEMSVARNLISLTRCFDNSDSSSNSELANDFNPHEVGFQAEVYQGGEEGFRCQRDSTGAPVKQAFDVTVKDPSTLNNEI